MTAADGATASPDRHADRAPLQSRQRPPIAGAGDSRRLRERARVHWLDTGKDRWVARQRAAGRHRRGRAGVGAVALPRLQPAGSRTFVLLGHETAGVPEEHAVAGSLVPYRLAGRSAAGVVPL